MLKNPSLDEMTQDIIDRCSWSGVLMALQIVTSDCKPNNIAIDITLQIEYLFGFNIYVLVKDHGLVQVIDSFQRNLNENVKERHTIYQTLKRIKQIATDYCSCHSELAGNVALDHVVRQIEQLRNNHQNRSA